MSGSNFVSLLIDCGFQASLPAGIAWAATRLASRSSAATRHFMWHVRSPSQRLPRE